MVKEIQVGGYYSTVEAKYSIVDDRDFLAVSEYRWFQLKRNTTYAYTTIDGKRMALHRFIMGLTADDKRMVHHKDGNGLNNRRSNLVVCDKLYNSQSIRCINSTLSKGGSIQKLTYGRMPYLAYITINKKRYQKQFITEEEAKKWLAELVLASFPSLFREVPPSLPNGNTHPLVV